MVCIRAGPASTATTNPATVHHWGRCTGSCSLALLWHWLRRPLHSLGKRRTQHARIPQAREERRRLRRGGPLSRRLLACRCCSAAAGTSQLRAKPRSCIPLLLACLQRQRRRLCAPRRLPRPHCRGAIASVHMAQQRPAPRAATATADGRGPLPTLRLCLAGAPIAPTVAEVPPP